MLQTHAWMSFGSSALQIPLSPTAVGGVFCLELQVDFISSYERNLRHEPQRINFAGMLPCMPYKHSGYIITTAKNAPPHHFQGRNSPTSHVGNSNMESRFAGGACEACIPLPPALTTPLCLPAGPSLGG